MARRDLLVPAGIAALGIAAGLLAERIIVGRQVRYDADAEEDFGALHGRTVTVMADDGVGLHVEIDDHRAPSVSDDLTVIFCHGYSLNQDSWHFQRRDLRPFARLVFADQRAQWKVDQRASGHAVPLINSALTLDVSSTRLVVTVRSSWLVTRWAACL